MTAISLNCWSESDQKAIREQLVRILNSGPFHQSQRRQRFLEYLVNETLAGRGERLKGYNVALEVFDRPETFDPMVDPLVRIEAARLREKLREYYDGPTAKAIPFASIYRRARTPRKSSFGTTCPRQINGRDSSRSTRILGSVASQPGFRKKPLGSGGLHNCSFACAACRFRRVEVVESIHSII